MKGPAEELKASHDNIQPLSDTWRTKLDSHLEHCQGRFTRTIADAHSAWPSADGIDRSVELRRQVVKEHLQVAADNMFLYCKAKIAAGAVLKK